MVAIVRNQPKSCILGERMDKRVLVVNDDEPTRQMISAVLKRSGLVADLCENGREGLDRLASAHYGAIILSLVRRDPRGDADLLRELKLKERPPCVVGRPSWRVLRICLIKGSLKMHKQVLAIFGNSGLVPCKLNVCRLEELGNVVEDMNRGLE
jgi:CheY-like chemotaxis protein